MKLMKFNSATETASGLIEHLLKLMSESSDNFSIALSGGSTPALMFDLWANDYKDKTDWSRLFIYWVDERCVAPEDSDSNFGMAKKLLLDKVPLSENQIFRIKGEADPTSEAKRYSNLALQNLPQIGGFPIFDVVLLGAGNDGHTSSIFPGQEELLITPKPFAACYNPYSGQKRIAMTGQTIIKANLVIFLITGKDKASVVADMYSSGDIGPAAYIAHHASPVELFLDSSAASKLNE